MKNKKQRRKYNNEIMTNFVTRCLRIIENKFITNNTFENFFNKSSELFNSANKNNFFSINLAKKIVNELKSEG